LLSASAGCIKTFGIDKPNTNNEMQSTNLGLKAHKGVTLIDSPFSPMLTRNPSAVQTQFAAVYDAGRPITFAAGRGIIQRVS
jgi:hypothetical protein